MGTAFNWLESVQCREEVGAFIKRIQKFRFPKNRKFLARSNKNQISSKKFDRRINWLSNVLESRWTMKWYILKWKKQGYNKQHYSYRLARRGKTSFSQTLKESCNIPIRTLHSCHWRLLRSVRSSDIVPRHERSKHMT